jgi:hypothetical protein
MMGPAGFEPAISWSLYATYPSHEAYPGNGLDQTSRQPLILIKRKGSIYLCFSGSATTEVVKLYIAKYSMTKKISLEGP